MGLAQLRMHKLLSRKELAERVGVRRATLSLWENGKAQPRMEYIRKLVEVLEVDVDTLLETLEKGRKGKGAGSQIQAACLV